MLGRKHVGDVANLIIARRQKDWKGVAKAEEEIDDALMRLGRYGYQDVPKLEELEVHRVRAMHDSLCRLLEEEHKATKH